MGITTKKKITWRKESQLRALMRTWWGESVAFIEPGVGGDVGLPDCFVMEYGVWVELKVAKWCRDKFTANFRIQQLKAMARLERYGVPAITMFVEYGGGDSRVWYCLYADIKNFYPMDTQYPRKTFSKIQQKIFLHSKTQ